MSGLQALPRASAPAALGSLVSLAAQGFLALVLFKLFSPEAVGVFAATSQIAFFWASLALAQSPLSLLANPHEEPRAAARRAWRQSAWRLLWLAPLAAWGAAWAELGPATMVWTWAAALGFSQLSWQLAQSLTLRVGSRWSMGLVRMVPPLLAAALAVVGAGLWHGWHGAEPTGEGGALVLLLSACVGYLAGASWMRLAFRKPGPDEALAHAQAPTTEAPRSGDPRSTRLKMLHTLMDGLAATALALSWPAHHGLQEAGWLLALLRVLSFIPALVHTAWAQVVLSHAGELRLRPMQVALGAAALVVAVGALTQAALALGWLDARWQGLSAYVWPLVVWQMAACLSAAHAHLPFQKGLAVLHSWLCVAMNAGFIALCVGLPGWAGWSAGAHLMALCSYAALSLLALTAWLVMRRPQGAAA